MANSPQLPFITSHAFIIGINDYVHITPLKTAVNDANGIAQRLEAQHGYQVHGPLLNPTKADLDKLFNETLPQVVGAEDRVVFYFAGHGIALDGEEGPNGYLVPVDAIQGEKETLVPMDKLHQSLNELPCKHGLLILDCCFSGAFKWSTGYRDVIFDLPKVIYEERFWRYVKDPAWQVITSSAHDQKAVDVISNQSIGMREEGEGMHSPFAKALFEAIEGAGDIIPADRSDGVITASELYAYLRDSVESQTQEQSKRQSPSMFNLARHDNGEFIFLNPRHPLNLDPTPDRNPFMGLASYNEADSNFFFGRDRVTKKLVERVQNQPLTVVSGASGTGKSSVIKAGVLPQLRKAGWELLPIIRPGKEPMKVLKEELPDIHSLMAPQEKELSIDEQLGELLQSKNSQGADKKFLLIIDQYEELISQCLKEEDRQAFEAQLANWLGMYSNLKIILSVRADFEPQFESEALKPWWQKGRYVVPAFSREEIREVITKPALQAVLFYEPLELVDRLEEDVSQAPGALPLLSFTLSELYYASLKKDRKRALTMEDYQEIGGVIGALRSKADEVYLAQDKEHKQSMQKLMLRMVSLEGGEIAGKRVLLNELTYQREDETARIKEVAKQLVDARLVLQGKDSQGRIYLEPAHDALVRAWARLWDWIKEVGEEKLIWQNKLSIAVKDYYNLDIIDPKKAKNLLWNSNPRLDMLKEEITDGHHNLNEKEETFVIKSIALKTKEYRDFIRNIILIGASLVAISIVAGIFFYRNKENQELATQRGEEVTTQTNRANTFEKSLEQKLKEAESLVLSAQALSEQGTNSTLAIHAAMAAYVRTDSPTFQSKTALLSALYGNRDRPYYIQKYTEDEAPDFSKGKNLFDENSPGVKTFMDSINKGRYWPLTLEDFSPAKDRWLVSGQKNLGAHMSRPVAYYINRDRKRISILKEGYSTGTCGFTTDGNRFFVIHNDPSESQIAIWDAIEGRKIQTLEGGMEGGIEYAAFSENGTQLISKDETGNSYLWDLEIRDEPLMRIETQASSRFLKIADNNEAFISQEENQILLRDMEGKVLFQKMIPKNTYTKQADISSDARLIVYPENDNQIAIANWKTQEIQRFSIQAKSTDQQNKIYNLHFTPDNQQVFGILGDKVQYYDLTGKLQKEVPFSHGEFLNISNSGEILSSYSILEPDYNLPEPEKPEITATLWQEGRESTETYRLKFTQDSDDEPEVYVQYIPQQKKLLMGHSDRTYYNGTIEVFYFSIFDLRSQTSKQMKLGKGISHLASSSDNSLMAGITEQVNYKNTDWGMEMPETGKSEIVLWNLEDGKNSLKEMYIYPGHRGNVSTLAFSSDGNRIISAGDDKTIRIWYTPKGVYEQVKKSRISQLNEKEVREIIGI